MLLDFPRRGPTLAWSVAIALSFSTPAWAQKAQKKAVPTKAAPKKGGLAKPASAPPAPPAPPKAPPAPPGKKKGPKTPDDDTNKMLEDAQKAAKAGNWEEARSLLVKVYKLRPTWRVAGELGRAEVGVEKWRDGAEHLTIALRDKPDDLPEAELKVLETALAQARTKIGVLRVNVAQKGAEIVIAGNVAGTSPLAHPVFVDPGKVLIEARLEGYYGLRATKDVAAGAEETVDFTLHRDSGAGTVAAPPPAGERLIRGRNLIILISGASAAGVATVLGGVLAILSVKKASASRALEEPTRTCSPVEDCAAQFDALQKAKVNLAGGSMWSFIGAGALLVGTGTYLTIQLLTKTNTNVKTSVVVRPDLVGGNLQLSF